MPDRYEVRDGIFKLAHRVDDNGTQWTQKVSLERLEVLANDRALNLPFASCTEEKFTRQNKYADHLGQDSKFEEIHQVPLRFHLLIKRKRHRFTGIFGVGEGEKGDVGKGEGGIGEGGGVGGGPGKGIMGSTRDIVNELKDTWPGKIKKSAKDTKISIISVLRE